MDNEGSCGRITEFRCASWQRDVVTSLSKSDTRVSQFHIISGLGALSRGRGCRRGTEQGGKNAEGEKVQRPQAQTGEASAKEVAEVRGELYEQNRQNFDHFDPIWRRGRA